MKRKMLVSISLLVIMILNCIMPLFVVNAADNVGVRLNLKLYRAVKKSLDNQNISYIDDVIAHSLTVNDVSKVTTLNLENGYISDLTGLDYFTSLEHLDISGNNLSSKSNLEVLNNLPNLTYLDLSTNHLEDYSAIEGFLQNSGTADCPHYTAKDGYTVLLSGQTLKDVQKVYINTQEGSANERTATFELPKILELAGLIKYEWKTITPTPEPSGNGAGAPVVDKQDIPMFVNESTNSITVKIRTNSGTPYLGMTKVYIHIYDNATVAAQASNENRASENILNESEFCLYYVVCEDKAEAITTPDTNLYQAIKDQLTGGQTINKDLISYPYKVDEDGNPLFNYYFYKKVDDTTYYLYTKKDDNDNPIYELVFDASTGDIKYYAVDDDDQLVDGGTYLEGFKVEPTTISKVDDEGVVTLYQVFPIPVKGLDGTGENLYIAAYDDAETFVIEDSILVNKITSLILNQKRIRDLEGLQYFVGLTSKINVSQNYLSDIDPLYELDGQKDEWEEKIRQEYIKWLSQREYGNLSKAVSELDGKLAQLNGKEKELKEASNKIINILKEAAKIEIGDGQNALTQYEDKIKAKAGEIGDVLKQIRGYDEVVQGETKHVKGIVEYIEEYETDFVKLLNGEGNKYGVYEYLSKLYDIYNNEYRLTTMLTDSLNYMTTDEYKAYDELYWSNEANKEQLYGEVRAQINRVTTMEANGSLSDFDKMLLDEAFPGIPAKRAENKDDKTPINTYFTEYLDNTPLDGDIARGLLDTFREIGIYSEMANYCLIRRMNETTPNEYCYAEDYLKERIAEFDLDDIPTDLEKGMLKAIQEGMGNENTRFYYVFANYCEAIEYRELDDETSTRELYLCKGPYYPVTGMIAEKVPYTAEELIDKAKTDLDAPHPDAIDDVMAYLGDYGEEGRTTYKEVNIREEIDVESTIYVNQGTEDSDLRIYNQMMALAKKLLNGDTNRYIFLPRLKRLDISHNADIENLEGITTFADTLSELNAESCYIADVSNVDWAAMKNLKKINVGFNFISDIRPFTQLENLKYLNLRKNRLEGVLNIPDEQCVKLFKHLQELDLSLNQITDIKSILDYLNWHVSEPYANYLAREDTLNINLQGQDIRMYIDEEIDLADHPYTVDIELPPIFNQLLDIDVNRTSFGEKSQNGRIESEGKYVTLNTRTPGYKTGEVVVVPFNGNGEDVDTCIGKDTTAHITYEVVGTPPQPPTNKTLESIEVTTPPTKTGYVAGETFEPAGMVVTATYSDGTKAPVSDYTFIPRGALTKENNTITISYTEGTITKETTQTIIVEEENNDENAVLESIEVTTPPTKTNYVEGESFDKSGMVVTATYSDGTAGNIANYTITPSGALTTNDTSVTISYTKGDVTKETTQPITVTEKQEEPDPIDPNDHPVVDFTPGYTKEDTALVNVKAKTSLQDFSSVLLNGQPYHVVVVKEEEGEVKSGNIATGMLAKVVDDEGRVLSDNDGHLYVYEIVVKGDVNGDGSANSLDSLMIKAYKARVIELSGNNFTAADIDNSGTITVNDARLLLYHRAEVPGYNLNYVK